MASQAFIESGLISDSSLPLAPYLREICEGLLSKGAAIVRADPGSGKSTLLPLSLLEARGGKGKIILLEPRRAAVLGIASRMAELLGEKAGERVGYAVRLERKVSEQTRIEVLTEGLFIRRIQADPSLTGISTVIFDEFHERSVMTDLALAFLLDLRRMGSPVNVLIMSATMNAGEIAAFINRAEGRSAVSAVPVFDVPCRVFPVETSHLPLPGKAPIGIETGTALTKILRDETQGDTLVFLPGRREIAAAERTIRLWERAGEFEILPLHGGLPLSRQREIIAPRQRTASAAGGQKRRIILSTNIAESALTIPGITMVVDTGYVRLERFHIPSGMNRLSLEEAGFRSAEQRAGRAGRLGPGCCIRLWDASSPRHETADPEIRRIDLSGLVLECLLWGVRSRDDLLWLEPPPLAAWERASGLLLELGAIDKNMKVTALGRETVKLGLEPRLGILCIAGREAGYPGMACAAAAVLSDRDGSAINSDGDFRRRLVMLRNAWAGSSKNPPAEPWARSMMETRDDLIRRLRLPAGTENRWTLEDENNAGELLAAAFPDRIAVRQESGRGDCGAASGRFRFVSGREARIEGPLENSHWLVAAEVDAGERSAFIRLGAPVSEETALAILKRQTVSEIRVEWKNLVPKTVISRRAGRLFLGEERRVSSRQEAEGALPQLLRENGLAALPWAEDNGTARRLLERIRFFAAAHDADTGNTGQSHWSDEALIHDAVEWLAPFFGEPESRSGAPILTASSLKNALKNRLGWDRIPVLDQEVPEAFALPNGRSRMLSYDSGEPVLSARLQDCFGISVHPKILGTPVVFYILSPANRPVQITSDIIGFWSGSYADVRKDMKGRYPKHFWPENPTQV